MGNCCSSKKQKKNVEEPKIQEDLNTTDSKEKLHNKEPSKTASFSCSPKSCSKKQIDAVIEPASQSEDKDEQKSKYDNEPVVDFKLDLPEQAEKTSIRSENVAEFPKVLDSDAVESFADAVSSDCQRVVLEAIDCKQDIFQNEETVITPDFVEETLIQPVKNEESEGGSRIEGTTLEEYVNNCLPIRDETSDHESDSHQKSQDAVEERESTPNDDSYRSKTSLEFLSKAADASPKIVWDEAETRGGKRKGTDLFERRRQLCDQHTMESQKIGPKDDLFATKQKVANLAGGMRTPAQSNEFLSSIAKDDEMAREKLSKRYAEMEKRGQLGQRNPGAKKTSQENVFNFQPNKSISDFDQPVARPRRWSRGSTQSLETEPVDTDLLRSDEKSYQVRQLIDKETGKRLEYNKLAAVPKIQAANPADLTRNIEPIAEQDTCVSDRITEFNRQPDVVIDMEKSKLDFSSYSSGATTLSRAEEEKLSPETLKKRKERFSENETTGVDLKRKMNDGFQDFLDFVDDCQSEASAVLEGNFVKPDPDKEDMFKRTLSQRGRESPCPRHWGEINGDIDELPKMTRPDRKIGGASYKELAALPPKKF